MSGKQCEARIVDPNTLFGKRYHVVFEICDLWPKITHMSVQLFIEYVWLFVVVN